MVSQNINNKVYIRANKSYTVDFHTIIYFYLFFICLLFQITNFSLSLSLFLSQHDKNLISKLITQSRNS